MLSRNEFVSEVLAVYETIDYMQKSITELRNATKPISFEVSKEPRDSVSDKLIDYAKIKIVEEVTFSWKMIVANRDEYGIVHYTTDSFNEWIDEKVDKRDLPEWLSYEAFKEQCCDILYKEYLADRVAALDKLEEEEAEGSEGNEGIQVRQVRQVRVAGNEGALLAQPDPAMALRAQEALM